MDDRDRNILGAVKAFVEEKTAGTDKAIAAADATRRELEGLGRSLAEERDARVREAVTSFSGTAGNLISWLEGFGNAPE